MIRGLLRLGYAILLHCVVFSLKSTTQNSIRFKTRLHLVPTFLSDYVTHSLYTKDELSIMFEPLSRDKLANYIALVDLNVRSWDDLPTPLGVDSWPQFVAKAKSSGQTLDSDKFLYMHDCGDDTIQKIGIARIPKLMYQKLVLARKISESISMEKDVAVQMLTLFGDTFLDAQMCEALQAAMQAQRFDMPTLKSKNGNDKGGKNGISPQRSSSSSSSADGNKKSLLHFVVPEAASSSPNFDNIESFIDPQALQILQGQQLQAGGDSGDTSNNDNDEVEWGEGKAMRYRPGLVPLSDPRVSALIEVLTKEMAATAASIGYSSDSDSSSSSKSSVADEEKSNDDDNIYFSGVSDSSVDFAEDLPTSISDSDNNSGNNKKLSRLQRYLKATAIVDKGTNLARALTSLPPNILNPKSYTELIRELATRWGCNFREWTPSELAGLGLGAFVAVTDGNGPILDRDDRLIKLRYNPAEKDDSANSEKEYNFWSKDYEDADSGGGPWRAMNSMLSLNNKTPKPLVLVGKGVCYDTGGVNVKSASSMKTMKHDMAGSAAALAAFLSLVELKFPFPVECWLGVVENNGAVGAMRPDDVVSCVTGETIEVVHSDAEGRMLLADMLAVATRKVTLGAMHESYSDSLSSPRLVIDFATLTGTCVSSLSNRYLGALTNRREWVDPIIQAGEKSGERVWPFPLDEDFSEDLLSDIADVLQCRLATEADHIYAASFLNRFVNPVAPWIHLDMGSAYRQGGLGHIGSDYTGCGARLAMELIKKLSLK